MKIGKRALALLLCLLLCASLIPAAAAEDIEIMDGDTEEDHILIVDPVALAKEAVAQTAKEDVEVSKEEGRTAKEPEQLVPGADAELQATETVTVGQYTYTITDGTAVLTKYNGTASSITVPTSMQYNGVTYKIRKVGDSAYAGNTFIQSVTIPDGILSLGNCAFKDCTSLCELTINGDIGDCNKNCITSTDYPYVNYTCDKFSAFYNTGTNADDFTVTFGEHVTRIPAYLFATGVSVGRF